METLRATLKTKAKVLQFAESTGLPVDFLTVLRREVNSYHPAARKIKEFPHLDEGLKDSLTEMGIKTTKELFERIGRKSDRKELRAALGISESEMIILVKTADVSRLRYVNPTFAALLVSSRFDTVEKIKKRIHRIY